MINIFQHLDVWTSAIETRSTAGRGSSNKLNLYGIKKLRELILELAVRGQLVPQNPDDEPASVLLEKIAAEKARLIKDGKLKKQESLPPITDEEKPFELPKGWEWTYLGNVGLVASSSRVHQKDWKDSGVPFYRAREIVKLAQFGMVDNELFISQELFHRLIEKGAVPEKDDIMITGVGTIGVPYVVKRNDSFYFKDASVLIFKNLFYLYSQYICHFMKSIFWNNCIHEGSMGTTVHTLTIQRANQIFVPMPPLAEQHRIVAKVNELMSLCDVLEQEQAANIAAHQTLVEELLAALTSSTPNSPPSLTLPPQGVEGTREKNLDALLLPSPLAGEGLGMGGMPAWARIATHFDTLFTTEHSIDQLKQTILQLAVMGKLVPQDPNDEPASRLLQKIAAEKARLIKEGKIKKEKPLPAITEDEKPFELPDGWEWCRLGSFSHVFAGASFKSTDFQSYSGIRVIKITNAGVGELIETDDYLPESFLDQYGESQVFQYDLILALTRPYISTGLKISICPESYDKSLLNQRVAAIRLFVDSTFPYKYLSSDFVLDEYKLRFSGSGLQPNLKMSDVTELVIPIPPLAEQHRIVAKVDELMALCDAMKAQLKTAQTTQLQLADVLAEQAMGKPSVAAVACGDMV